MTVLMIWLTCSYCGLSGYSYRSCANYVFKPSDFVMHRNGLHCPCGPWIVGSSHTRKLAERPLSTAKHSCFLIYMRCVNGLTRSFTRSNKHGEQMDAILRHWRTDDAVALGRIFERADDALLSNMPDDRSVGGARTWIETITGAEAEDEVCAFAIVD